MYYQFFNNWGQMILLILPNLSFATFSKSWKLALKQFPFICNKGSSWRKDGILAEWLQLFVAHNLSDFWVCVHIKASVVWWNLECLLDQIFWIFFIKMIILDYIYLGRYSYIWKTIIILIQQYTIYASPWIQVHNGVFVSRTVPNRSRIKVRCYNYICIFLINMLSNLMLYNTYHKIRQKM